MNCVATIVDKCLFSGSKYHCTDLKNFAQNSFAALKKSAFRPAAFGLRTRCSPAYKYVVSSGQQQLSAL